MQQVPLTELDQVAGSGHHYAIFHHKFCIEVFPEFDHAKPIYSAGNLSDSALFTVQEGLSLRGIQEVSHSELELWYECKLEG